MIGGRLLTPCRIPLTPYTLPRMEALISIPEGLLGGIGQTHTRSTFMWMLTQELAMARTWIE